MQIIGSSESPDPLVGRGLLRGLRLVERLGATSEGPLYRGQYAGTGASVGVTLLRLPATPADAPRQTTLSERHWQQLRRACQIQHPNVAGLLDVGETSDGIVYAVAELLTGELVSDILAVSGGIPPPQALDICVQVANGLRAAHAAGVVHGNVSPQAVLVTGGGERLTVKLIRFDFTRQPEAPADGRAETWADHPLDPTDDIVGVGVLLHCLLTGVPPDGERRGRAVPGGLQRIIDRCLGDHGRHYPTVATLADDLARQPEANVQPLEAEANVQGRRASRRRPVVLATLAASVVLLAGALWFGWTRMRNDSAEARTEVATGTLEMAPDSQSPPAMEPRPADSARAANKVAGGADSVLATRKVGRRADSVLATKKIGRRADPVPATKRMGRQADSVNKAGRRADSMPLAATRPTPSQRPSDSSAVAVGTARGGARQPSATLSPFRRSHPWAAEPNGQVYFPSSCPQALGASDLLYFRTEAEARATGRTRSPDPRCA
jgi:Protein kinase domain